MGTGLIIGIAVAVVLFLVIVAVAVFVVITYNGLVKARNSVKNSFAQIDAQLQRRFDLLPNLVETVKRFATHEKRILENLELKGITSTYVVDLENNNYYIVGGAERVDGSTVYEYKEIVTAYDILVD